MNMAGAPSTSLFYLFLHPRNPAIRPSIPMTRAPNSFSLVSTIRDPTRKTTAERKWPTKEREKERKKQNRRKIKEKQKIKEEYQAYDITPNNRKFSGDESFLKDPNAFNDAINTQAKEGEGTLKKGFRL